MITIKNQIVERIKMKAKDLVLGTTVRMFNDTVKGKVINNNHSDGDLVVVVEWKGGTFSKVNVGDLVSCLADGLEEQYKAIQIKIDEATKLLKEANVIAINKCNFNLNELATDENGDDLINYSDLMQQLCNAGWSTSSMDC
jgi:hypothetical protein